MKDSSRLFNCALCHNLVNICSDCDRGNIYCSEACSTAARKESQREAGQRYQSTFKGRAHHANRQAAYRHREQEKTKETEKVTHHSSTPDASNDLLVTVPIGEESHDIAIKVNESRCCDFCSNGKFYHFRFDFIRHHPANSIVTTFTWPQGP